MNRYAAVIGRSGSLVEIVDAPMQFVDAMLEPVVAVIEIGHTLIDSRKIGFDGDELGAEVLELILHRGHPALECTQPRFYRRHPHLERTNAIFEPPHGRVQRNNLAVDAIQSLVDGVEVSVGLPAMGCQLFPERPDNLGNSHFAVEPHHQIPQLVGRDHHIHGLIVPRSITEAEEFYALEIQRRG